MNKGIEIGVRVREARTKAGFSMSSLAKHAGMSLAYVSLLEAGKIPAPTVHRLSRIATALDTPLEHIISEAEYSPAQRIEQHAGIIDELVRMAPNTDPDIARAFVGGLLHLSREDQAQVADLIARLRNPHQSRRTT
jgi:transcriptional regulator with XRE-family HTH domain